MRLADFIRSSLDAILAEWEQFAAAQLPAASSMSRLRLRDHAAQLLEVIAQDLAQAQTLTQQLEKSKGQAPVDPNLPDRAAHVHALMRAQDGFDINQVAGEYRALRASVLRLWVAQAGVRSTDFQDMLRFNEAIDQALVESIAAFSAEVERSRNLMLGMLGHDMRNPLNAILLTATYLNRAKASPEVLDASERLRRSANRMRVLLDELVDFSRTRLGVGIRVKREPTDLEVVANEEIGLIRTAFPDARVELFTSGEATGSWDANRIHQVLGNLVTNAIKHGAESPVVVRLEAGSDEVVFSVENEGEPIASEHLATIFEPLNRGGKDDDEGLGLGLYIAQQIVVAHEGHIEVSSEGTTTRFRVALPRADAA